MDDDLVKIHEAMQEGDQANLISKGLLKMGIKPINSSKLPRGNMSASLVEPHGGPALLVFNNFKVILSYSKLILFTDSFLYLKIILGFCNK